MSIEDENNYNNQSDNYSDSENESNSFDDLGVISLKSKKSKKDRNVTKGPLKRWDAMDRGVAKASAHLADACYRGVEDYLERRERSADDKRDGAIIDIYENLSKSAAKTIKYASDAPYEIAKAISELGPSKKAKKEAMRQLRKFSQEENKKNEQRMIERAIKAFNDSGSSSTSDA